MEYPTYRYKSTPTPSDKLVICDKCQKAEWTIYSDLIIYCYRYPCRSRKREATAEEYKEARKMLKENEDVHRF